MLDAFQSAFPVINPEEPFLPPETSIEILFKLEFLIIFPTFPSTTRAASIQVLIVEEL